MDLIDLICLGLVCAGLGAVVGALTEKRNKESIVIMKINELAGVLTPIVEGLNEVSKAVADVGPQLEKAKGEIIEAMGGTGEIPVEAMEKIGQLSAIAEGLKASAAALKTTSQALDDLNPDAPTTETPANG